MDDREGLIEELGWLKVIIVIAATLEFSLVGWLVNAPSPALVRIGAGGLAITVAGHVLWTARRANAILLVLKRSTSHDL